MTENYLVGFKCPVCGRHLIDGEPQIEGNIRAKCESPYCDYFIEYQPTLSRDDVIGYYGTKH